MPVTATRTAWKTSLRLEADLLRHLTERSLDRLWRRTRRGRQVLRAAATRASWAPSLASTFSCDFSSIIDVVGRRGTRPSGRSRQGASRARRSAGASSAHHAASCRSAYASSRPASSHLGLHRVRRTPAAPSRGCRRRSSIRASRGPTRPGSSRRATRSNALDQASLGRRRRLVIE